jgi:hypothetical protein
MRRKSTYINIGLLATSILLIGLFIRWQIADEFSMVNETLAMVLFAISLIFKLYKLKIGQYLIFILLLILLSNAIKFSYTIVNDGVSTTYYSASFNSLSINPIVFVVLILYMVVNGKFIWDLYNLLAHGSDKEQKEKQDKNIAFYYEKFKNYSTTEMNDIFKVYKDYPIEAQIALKRIKKEKEG